MQSMWCHWSLGRRLYTTCQKPKEETRSQKEGKKVVVSGVSNCPIVEQNNDGSKTRASHIKVPSGYAVLDRGAAKSPSGAKPIAQMAQTCAREGKRVGDERDTEAIDESYHFPAIGNHIVSSFMKLRVHGSIDGKEVSFAPSVTPGDIPPLMVGGIRCAGYQGVLTSHCFEKLPVF